jgi:hypothetical protein
MTPDLSRRIAHAFRIGAADLDERDRLRAAAGPVHVKTFDDLPPDAQALLLDLETRKTALDRMRHPGQPTVVETVLIEVDAQGRVTKDRTQAVGGEVIEILSDGRSRSTLFTIDPSAAGVEPPD